MICGICRGKKEVKYSTGRFIAGLEEFHFKPCTDCNGSGIQPDEKIKSYLISFEGVKSRMCYASDVRELKEENTALNISIRKVTDERDMVIREYADLLMDSEGIYSDLRTTGRVKCPTEKYFADENKMLAKLKDNQEV